MTEHKRNTSAKMPRLRWRRARLLAGTLALTSGVFATGMVATVGTAEAASFSPVTTQEYTIGTPATSVSSLSASVSPATSGSTGYYAIKFTTPVALSATNTITLSSSGETPAFSFSAAANVGVADTTSGAIVSTTFGTTATTLTVTLSTGASIGAGDNVLLSFSEANPTVTANTTYTLDVSTSASTTLVSTTLTISSTSSVTVSSSSTAIGAGATYTLSGPGLTIPSSAGNTLTLAATTLTSNASSNPGGVTWSGSPGSYSLTVVNSSGSTVTAPTIVSAAPTATPTSGLDDVVLTLGSNLGLLSTDGKSVLTVTGTGTNPTTAGTTDYFGVGFSPSTTISPWSNNSITFGGLVGGVAVTPSPASANASATYTVSFLATDGVPGGGSITFVAPDGTSFSSSSGAVVTDTTSGASAIVTGSKYVVSTTTNTDDTVTLTVPFAISKQDAITVMVYGVTNPSSGTYSGTGGFAVTTTNDSISSYNATAYTIGAPVAPGTVAPVVTVNPPTAGALATYTIATFKAASALVAGTDTIELLGPSGTLFPGAGYTLTDSTTNTTQTLTVKSGAGTDDVVLNLANNIASGDVLSLSIASVVNPGTGSSTYTISLGADTVATNTTVAGTQGLTALAVSFPHADVSFPNGAIVQYGTTMYVMAGGRAFGVPTPGALTKIMAVDKAKVIKAASGATPPTTVSPRSGTLVTTNAVNGAGTIYVVGTDGQLHGFATPKQFVDDGYDPALTVTVPNTGGLTMGSPAGTSLTALVTVADGALVNSSKTIYVLAGGRAFGIPGPKKFAAIKKTDTAITLTGTIGASLTSHAIADGVLVTVAGPVFVSYNGNLFPFKAMAQLQNDGYGGTAAVPLPSTGGLAIASTYAGS